MAPEQVRGERSDFRADIFSFGALVYELASGCNPFAGPDLSSSSRTLEVEPAPLSQDDPDVPPALDGILRRCLQKDPSARYESSEALRSDLEELRDEVRGKAGRGPAGRSAPEATSWPPRRWWRVHQAIVSGVYVLALLPLWLERASVPLEGGMPAVLAALAIAVTAASIRLHLWFSTRVYPAEMLTQRRRARVWLRACDLGLAAILVAVALAIGSARPYPATLLVALAAGVSVANVLIEPSTERAAFGGSA
jgi:hypothetical protein